MEGDARTTPSGDLYRTLWLTGCMIEAPATTICDWLLVNVDLGHWIEELWALALHHASRLTAVSGVP